MWEKHNYLACNYNNNNKWRHKKNQDMADEVSEEVVSKKEVMHSEKNNH